MLENQVAPKSIPEQLGYLIKNDVPLFRVLTLFFFFKQRYLSGNS